MALRTMHNPLNQDTSEVPPAWPSSFEHGSSFGLTSSPSRTPHASPAGPGSASASPLLRVAYAYGLRSPAFDPFVTQRLPRGHHSPNPRSKAGAASARPPTSRNDAAEKGLAGPSSTLAHGELENTKSAVSHQTGPLEAAQAKYLPLGPEECAEWYEKEEEPDALAVNKPEQRQSSFAEASFNATNMLMGVGILSLPYALKESGWFGLGVIVVQSLITLYTGLLIWYCQGKIANTRFSAGSYPDIGEAAFGVAGRAGVGIVLYTELFSVLCLFMILLGTNLHHLMASVSSDQWMMYASAAMVPLALLRDLSLLSYVSMVGIVATYGLLGMVLYTGLTGDIFNDPAPTHLIQGSFPLSFGLIGFCFSGHAVFPSVFKSMEDPSRVPVMLVLSYSMVTLGYCAMAAVGYLLYGDQVQEQVTMSLGSGTGALIVTGLIVVNGVSKFALSIAPLAMGLDELIEAQVQAPSARWIAGSIVRILVVAAAWQVATNCTFFAYVASFIGAVLSMLVSVILPSLCYMRLFRDEIGICTKAWNWLVVLCGIFAAVGGTYATIMGVAGS